MHIQRTYPLALALLALCALAALVLAGVIVMGMHLTPWRALAALGVSAVLVAAAVFVHDALRAARWNAGHRLR